MLSFRTVHKNKQTGHSEPWPQQIWHIYKGIKLIKSYLLNQSSFALPNIGNPLAWVVVCNMSTPMTYSVLMMFLRVNFLSSFLPSCHSLPVAATLDFIWFRASSFPSVIECRTSSVLTLNQMFKWNWIDRVWRSTNFQNAGFHIVGSLSLTSVLSFNVHNTTVKHCTSFECPILSLLDVAFTFGCWMKTTMRL